MQGPGAAPLVGHGAKPQLQRSREAQLRVAKDKMLGTAKRFQRTWQEQRSLFYKKPPEPFRVRFSGTNVYHNSRGLCGRSATSIVAAKRRSFRLMRSRLLYAPLARSRSLTSGLLRMSSFPNSICIVASRGFAVAPGPFTCPHFLTLSVMLFPEGFAVTGRRLRSLDSFAVHFSQL